MIWSPERAKEKISWPRKMDAGTQPNSSSRWCCPAQPEGGRRDSTSLPGAPHHTVEMEEGILGERAEVFGGRDEVRASEQKISKLERLLGQKEVELALLKNFLDES